MEGKINRRIAYLDVLRVLACAMVVLMHTPHPDAGVPGFVQVPIYFLTAGGLVLFFMVSGALLLPSKMSTSQFLKRRISKIAGPWLFWTFFYMAINVSGSGLTLSEIYKLFVMVSFPGGHVMWFMFVLLGLYLIAPILSEFVQHASRKEIEFYLLLWGITLITPWLIPCTTLNMGISSPLYYFSGYVGYFVLGYYLNSYGTKIPFWVLPLCIVLPVCCLFLYKSLGGTNFSFFRYLSVFVALMAIAWFETAHRFSKTQKLGGGNSYRVEQLQFWHLLNAYIHPASCFVEHRFCYIRYGMGWTIIAIMFADTDHQFLAHKGHFLSTLFRIYYRLSHKK